MNPTGGLTVLYVTPFFVPIIGGVETVLYETATGMVKRGHTPVVLTGRTKDLPEKEIMKGFQVVRAKRLNVPESGVVDPENFSAQQIADLLREIIVNFNVDVVHLHNYHMKQYAMFLFGFLKAINTTQTPTLLTVHNTTTDPFAHYLLSYLPISKLIAITCKSAFDLISGGVPAGRIEVIPNMLDTEKFHNADGGEIRRSLGVEGEPLILFPSRLVGRERNTFGLEEGKGLHILLRALPLIKRELPDAKLLLIGNDPVYYDLVRRVRRNILQTAAALGVGDSLVFFDREVPQRELPNIFAASDVVVSLSPVECFGMVFLEGMAAGKPVIGVNSYDNGVPEVIRDGRAGFLVPPNDPWSTAKKLIRVLSEPGLAQKMGREASRWVKENYDVDVVLPKLIKLYERCLLETSKNEPKPIDTAPLALPSPTAKTVR